LRELKLENKCDDLAVVIKATLRVNIKAVWATIIQNVTLNEFEISDFELQLNDVMIKKKKIRNELNRWDDLCIS
jgi:hypothetical protein